MDLVPKTCKVMYPTSRVDLVWSSLRPRRMTLSEARVANIVIRYDARLAFKRQQMSCVVNTRVLPFPSTSSLLYEILARFEISSSISPEPLNGLLEMETLDCIYGGSIIYQYLPPDDLGGINGLYSSQYLAQRDTNFLRIFTATTHDGSEMLYKLYSSAIRQHYWPELVDVRDTTATWLVTCPGPHHDSALTVARTLVALDARWSIVGLLSFGDFGIVLKGRLTDAQVVSLERWEFPAGLLRIGNPTALFRGKASSNVGPSTELEGHSNSSNLATASAVAEARIINDSASEISRGVIEGPSLSNDNNNIADSSSSTSWPQPQIPPFADDGYATSDDDDSDSDTLSSNFSSDEDEEQLPSYRHASRRLARERRLLAQDPSEVEDPAGAAISCRDVVGEGEEGDSDVPPTYHDRGEGAPDYVEFDGK